MNLQLWTITPSSTAPTELVDRFPYAANHDSIYNWFVASEDSHPTQVRGDTADEISLNLIKVLDSGESVTVTKPQAKAIYSHPLHRLWVGNYETTESFEADSVSAATLLANLPSLPAQGTPLTEGVAYSFGGQAYQVRQTHIRTEHAPNTLPALFYRYRILDDGNEWVEGEWVVSGSKRDYSGVTYVAIQTHQTQLGWEPPNVPALWKADVLPSVDWQAGVLYSINDEVVYNGVTYSCIQAHTSLVGWEPPNVPALWQEV
jgi:hypothetical protein